MKRIYLEFEGQQYDVGTKVLMHSIWYGDHEAVFERGVEGILTFMPLTDQYGKRSPYSTSTESFTPERVKIIKIIDPVPAGTVYVNARQRPMDWEIENAWIWYIIIMVGGVFFYDRWTIWICATLYFVLWKNGFFRG